MDFRKPHKHAELIKAWADGAEIEERYIGNGDYEGSEWYVTNGDWSDTENWEYRIKPEPKPDVPDGLIDPKSYYEGYEDGVNAIDLRPISWMKDCGGFTDDPVLAVEDGFNIPVYISKENYKKIKQRKPDVDVKEHIQLHYFENSKYPRVVGDRAKIPNVLFRFDGETGELKSAEVLK